MSFCCLSIFNLLLELAGEVSLRNLHAVAHLPPPNLPAGVLPGRYATSLTHVGPPPTLHLAAPRSPCLVGENVALRGTLTAAAGLQGGQVEVALQLTGAITLLDCTATLEVGGRRAAVDQNGLIKLYLPMLPASGSAALHLQLQTRAPGRVTATFTALSPAAVECIQELTFKSPFECNCRFTSEPNSHILPFPLHATSTTSPAAGPAALVVGQPVILTVAVKALQPANLQLLDVQLVPNAASGLQLMCDLSHQLPPTPVPVSSGSDLQFMLHMMPTRLVQSASAGKLLLKWRRAPLPAASAASDGASRQQQQHQQQQEGGVEEQSVGTLLDLASVTVQDAILAIKTLSPPQASAGVAFAYLLHVQNSSGDPQDLTVSLTDTNGFLVSGERQQVLNIGSQDKGMTTWQLVAPAPGHYRMPVVRVSCAKLNCTALTNSTHVFVAAV